MIVIDYMKIAVEEGKKGFDLGEIPVGVVITSDNKIVATAHNNRLNPLGHAELIALQSLDSKYYKSPNLDMYVTLEPCPMCGGAIMQTRIRRLYFGAFNKISGAFGTVLDVTKAYSNGIEVYSGINSLECEELMKSFFALKRG